MSSVKEAKFTVLIPKLYVFPIFKPSQLIHQMVTEAFV